MWRGIRFSRWLMGVALVCASMPATLSAQLAPRNCTPQVTPATVRGEGLSELLPDIVLLCTGGTPTPGGQSIPRFTVQVTFNVPAASRLLTVSLTEALLLVDEPAPASQIPCTSILCTATSGGPGGRNVYQGSRLGDNGIQFVNVPIDGGTHSIRLTNLRANANVAGGQPIVATIGFTGQEPVTLTTAIVTMATVAPGLQFSVLNATNGASGVPVQINRTQNLNIPLTSSSPLTLTLRFTEAFAAVFRERSIASSIASPSALGIQATPAQTNDPLFRNLETGFYNPAYPSTNSLQVAGAATSGTRLMARFNNVPPGVALYASVAPTTSPGTGITARLVTTDSTGLGPYIAVPATQIIADNLVGVAPLPILNGVATAVWEVLDPTVNIEFLTFGIAVASLANTPPEGEMTVNGSLGPFNALLTNAPPRFQPGAVNLSAVVFTNNPTTPSNPGNPGSGGGGGTVGPSGPLTIVGQALPQGTVNTPYPRTVLSTLNGIAPFNWNIALGGSLPPGMLLTSNGEILGTPTMAGTFNFVLRVTDGTFQLATLPMSIVIRPPAVTITQTVFPVQPSVGQTFGPIQLTPQGGSAPYSWIVVNSSLPPGLTLSPNGVLSGTPSSEGLFFFTIGVVDASGTSASQNFTLTVNPILSIGTPAPLPAVTVGGLYSLLLQGAGGTQPYRWQLSGGALPSGMTLSEAGLLQGSPTAPGLYGFTLQLRDGAGTLFTRAYTLQVIPVSAPPPGTPGAPSPYVPSQDSVGVVASPGFGPVTQTIRITNSTGTPGPVTATIELNQGSDWLQLVTINGTSSFDNPATFVITVNPAVLMPGTYTGTVIFTLPDGTTTRIPVVVTVPRPGPVLGAFPQGLTFNLPLGAPSSPLETINVLNSGTATTTFTSQITYSTPGASWLTFDGPSGGMANSGDVIALSLRANPAGLAPGDYYAEVRITSSDPSLPPQSVTVVLNVLPPGQGAPTTSAHPGGLLFTSRNSADFSLENNGSQALSFYSTRSSFDGQQPWFTVSPASGTLQPGQALPITVQPLTTPFNPGIKRGAVTFVFSDGTTRTVDLALVIGVETLSQPVTISSADKGPRQGATCNPSTLAPVFTVLSPGFSVNAGWPTPVEVRVADDCGAPLTQGSVALSFSNRDPGVPLTSLRDGRWSGVWVGRNTQVNQITITASAANANASLRGAHSITGTLAANALPPVVNSGGVVSSATFTGRLPVAPGSLISIFGSRLADSTAAASRLPLETTLANTSATLGGRSLPLLYSSDGQVNAIVPYSTATDLPQQLLIRRGNSLAVPEPVTVVPAQPDVFVVPLGSELAPAVTNATFGLVNLPDNAIRPGDAVVIFCTGLGSVSPVSAAGSAAPTSEPLARTDRVTRVTVGGVEAMVVYAGLAPGFTGLYQVVAVTGAGTPPGSVPVVITSDGKFNPVARINVR